MRRLRHQLPLSPPTPAACGASNGGGSAAASSEGVCDMNLSPWDLTSELDVPNPQEDPFDNYFVLVTGRPGLVFSSVALKEEDEKTEVEDKIGKQVINKQRRSPRR